MSTDPAMALTLLLILSVVGLAAVIAGVAEDIRHKTPIGVILWDALGMLLCLLVVWALALA